MARPLLLPEAVCYREIMRRRCGSLGLLALIPVTSCLYLGDRNHVPEGTLELQQSSARLNKGGNMTLTARINDPDSDTMTYEWTVKVVRQVDGGTCYLSHRVGPDNCSDTQPRVAWSGEGPTGHQLVLNKLPYRGTYGVKVRVSDPRGASTTAVRAVVVANDVPKVTLRLGVDPEYTDLDNVPDVYNSHPAHAHYMVRVAEKGLTDLEQDLICGKKATIKWTLEYPTGPKVDYEKVKPCQGKQVLDRYLFRFLPASVNTMFTLTIRAEVNDGHGGISTASMQIALQPDRPPCIVGVAPLGLSMLAAKTPPVVPVPHQDKQLFQVLSVSNDVTETLTYVWQVSQGKGWQVLPGVSEASYTMPPWFGAPGDTALLRVRVTEANASAPTCAEGELLCRLTSYQPDKCYQWVTWKVKFI